MRILTLNGINLNMFGKRDPAQYGTTTLDEINASLARLGAELGVAVECFQTNFEGEMVDITLKEPLGAAAGGQVAANRKKFRGTLERVHGGGWQILWSDAPPVKPGQRVSKKRVPAPLQALGFTLDELREARLAPIVDFKGRGAKPDAAD